MKRRFPGLHQAAQPAEVPDGFIWSASTGPSTAGMPRSPSTPSSSRVLEPKQFAGSLISGRIYCTEKALWKLSWFLRDFGYDAELLGHDELEEKRLVGLTGAVPGCIARMRL